MTDGALTIAGERIEPGTQATLRIRALELADGTLVGFDVIVLCGRGDGPIAYVGAGVHGDEVGGVATLAAVVSRIKLDDVRGTLIMVPVQNPLGFQAQHRMPLGVVLKSPTDQSPNDMYMAYPGDRNGNSTQVMTHKLWSELVRKASFLVDLHTPTVGGRYVPFAFIPPADLGEPARRSRDLAAAFGVDAILSTTKGVYVDRGTLHVAAARELGIPGFGVEMGEGGRVETEFVERGASGVVNLLRYAGVLDGAPEPRRAPALMREFVLIRAKRGGLFRTTATLGQSVDKGHEIGCITNTRGQVVEKVEAPVPGIFVRATTFPTVITGERVGQIGVLEDQE